MFKFKEYDIKQYNVSLLVVVVALGTIGAFLIKQVQLDSENLFEEQLIGLIGGILLALFVSLVDYHFIGKFYIVLYLINIGLLVWVKVDGIVVNYARRWINIFDLFTLQPSELSKIILIIFLAKLFTIFKNRINNGFFILATIILMAIPTYLILTQTDLSTSLVLVFIFVMLYFAAGLSWKIILPILAIGVPGFIILFWYIQQDYQILLSSTQQGRVLSMLNPELYPEVMYQQDNARQAIGAGQLYGKLFSGDTSGIRGYDSVPISESDFIFSVAGEEIGFIGSCFLLVLYGIIIFKCLMTAKKATDRFGMLIAIGIASMFMFQVFVNIGVVTSILPNTGIPLPFLSKGLSSLMGSMIGIGIILNIRLQQKNN